MHLASTLSLRLLALAVAGILDADAAEFESVGHSIVRAHIPPGTLLYHGRGSNAFPEADWIAFDPEHSEHFAWGDNGTLFTFATTRDLKLVYFDGCSANKAAGVVDTQDILIWGDLGHTAGNEHGGEHERLIDGCEWAKEYGVDGFVRMEMDFEIIYCDFTQGLELVSALNFISTPRGGPGRKPGGEQPPDGGHGGPMHGPLDEVSGPGGPADGPGGPGGPRGPGRGSPSTTPEGWKGSLPDTQSVLLAGSWHGPFPGDLRVRVEPASMLTFFDPAFTLANISGADVARAREDISDIFSRGPYERSGVDWQGLAQTVQGSLFAAAALSAEHVLHNALDEVLHELCRVLGSAWSEAFDIEEKSADVAAEMLAKWRDNVDTLVEWLDWPVWMDCEPGCAINEFCYVPQPRFGRKPGEDVDSTPRCVEWAPASL
ncbi:hypothetical protein EVJ58_g4634 [Rhodofomes roseus]|uniref:Uncharacterized protein n=1 Tax=Rhodofomes roseus TaxID=34475 RepID=A0A4Y9YFV6_9APHY|nr:hypothetical protein EVJ58_g4634 [Rhodofomes roseus]